MVIEAVNGMIQLVEQMDYAVMVVVIYIYCHSIDWLVIKNDGLSVYPKSRDPKEPRLVCVYQFVSPLLRHRGRPAGRPTPPLPERPSEVSPCRSPVARM